MNIDGAHVQFSKILAVLLCVFYVMQTAATFVLICINITVADPLLALMRNTLTLYGLIYGCYAGNSAVEKAVSIQKNTERFINTGTGTTGTATTYTDSTAANG